MLGEQQEGVLGEQQEGMLGEQQEGMLGELQLARGWQGRVICQGGASKLRAHV